MARRAELRSRVGATMTAVMMAVAVAVAVAVVVVVLVVASGVPAGAGESSAKRWGPRSAVSDARGAPAAAALRGKRVAHEAERQAASSDACYRGETLATFRNPTKGEPQDTLRSFGASVLALSNAPGPSYAFVAHVSRSLENEPVSEVYVFKHDEGSDGWQYHQTLQENFGQSVPSPAESETNVTQAKTSNALWNSSEAFLLGAEARRQSEVLTRSWGHALAGLSDVLCVGAPAKLSQRNDGIVSVYKRILKHNESDTNGGSVGGNNPPPDDWETYATIYPDAPNYEASQFGNVVAVRESASSSPKASGRTVRRVVVGSLSLRGNPSLKLVAVYEDVIEDDADDDVWALPGEPEYLTDGTAGSGFGSAVALGKSDVIVGATSGNGELPNQGAVYVFRQREDGEWQQSQKLSHDKSSANDLFGLALATNSDSDTLAVINLDPFRAVEVVIFSQGDAESIGWQQVQRLYNEVGGGRISDLISPQNMLALSQNQLVLAQVALVNAAADLEGPFATVFTRAVSNEGNKSLFVVDESYIVGEDDDASALTVSISDNFLLTGDDVGSDIRLTCLSEFSDEGPADNTLCLGATLAKLDVPSSIRMGIDLSAFGISATVSDGPWRVAIGSPALQAGGGRGVVFSYELAADIFANGGDLDDDHWTIRALEDPDKGPEPLIFGASVAISRSGEVLAIGAPERLPSEDDSFSGDGRNTGRVYVYEWQELSLEGGPEDGSSMGWNLVATLDPGLSIGAQWSGAYFGSNVAVAKSFIAAGCGVDFGSPDRKLYVLMYDLNPNDNRWGRTQIINIPGTFSLTSMSSIAASEEHTMVFIGAPLGGANGEGGVFTVSYNRGIGWALSGFITAPVEHGFTGNEFGRFLAVKESLMWIGSRSAELNDDLAVFFVEFDESGTKVDRDPLRTNVQFEQVTTVGGTDERVIIGTVQNSSVPALPTMQIFAKDEMQDMWYEVLNAHGTSTTGQITGAVTVPVSSDIAVMIDRATAQSLVVCTSGLKAIEIPEFEPLQSEPPVERPTPEPPLNPTLLPTLSPTAVPTLVPTSVPTQEPTSDPSPILTPAPEPSNLVPPMPESTESIAPSTAISDPSEAVTAVLTQEPSLTAETTDEPTPSQLMPSYTPEPSAFASPSPTVTPSPTAVPTAEPTQPASTPSFSSHPTATASSSPSTEASQSPEGVFPSAAPTNSQSPTESAQPPTPSPSPPAPPPSVAARVSFSKLLGSSSAQSTSGGIGSTMSFRQTASLTPGARAGSALWFGLSDNDVVVYGGIGLDSNASASISILDDLWHLAIDAKRWSRVAMSGSERPLRRFGAATWTSGDARVIFGGSGSRNSSVDASGGLLSDTWLLEHVGAEHEEENVFRWTKLSAVDNAEFDAPSVYSQQGEFALTNHPGARVGAATWADGGKMYLFGGFGYGDAEGERGYLADLWVFEGGLWAWIGGPTKAQSLLDRIESSWPRGRSGSAAWKIRRENGTLELWLYGGEGLCINGNFTPNVLDDVWRLTIDGSASANGSEAVREWVTAVNIAGRGECGVPLDADFSTGAAGRADMAAFQLKEASFVFGGLQAQPWLQGNMMHRSLGVQPSDDLWSFDARSGSWVVLGGHFGSDTERALQVNTWPEPRAMVASEMDAQSLRVVLYGGGSARLVELVGFENGIAFDVTAAEQAVYSDEVWKMDDFRSQRAVGESAGTANAAFAASGGALAIGSLGAAVLVQSAAGPAILSSAQTAARPLCVTAAIALFSNRVAVVPAPLSDAYLKSLEGFILHVPPPWRSSSAASVSSVSRVLAARPRLLSVSHAQFDPNDDVVQNPETQFLEGATFYVAVAYVGFVVVCIVLWLASKLFRKLRVSLLPVTMTLFIVMSVFLIDSLAQDSAAFLFRGNGTSSPAYAIVLAVLLLVGAALILIFLGYILWALMRRVKAGEVQWRSSKADDVSTAEHLPPSYFSPRSDVNRSPRSDFVSPRLHRTSPSGDFASPTRRWTSPRLHSGNTSISMSTTLERSATGVSRVRSRLITGSWEQREIDNDTEVRGVGGKLRFRFHDTFGSFYASHQPRYVLLAWLDIALTVTLAILLATVPFKISGIIASALFLSWSLVLAIIRPMADHLVLVFLILERMCLGVMAALLAAIEYRGLLTQVTSLSQAAAALGFAATVLALLSGVIDVGARILLAVQSRRQVQSTQQSGDIVQNSGGQMLELRRSEEEQTHEEIAQNRESQMQNSKCSDEEQAFEEASLQQNELQNDGQSASDRQTAIRFRLDDQSSHV